ncbi:MAG: peptidase domain protein [Chlorobi bacterium]|nr:peptidase domain protein [Chlorobiota bacterium]
MPYSIEQTDAQLRDTTAAIRYTLAFPQAAQHLVHVTMEVDSAADEIILAMPNWIPGSYKVRDFIAYQGDLRVAGSDGAELPFEWIAKNRLRVQSAGGNVSITYVYFGNERTVRLSHINRYHAFINPANALMCVEGRTEEAHHVAIDHPWSTVSTALSPVRSGVWGALNYDILADSPIEIGDHFVAGYDRHGARHEVAITGVGDFDAPWLAAQTERIIDHAVTMWGSLPYDRYVFIIQLLPGQYGGLEHARSSVNMFDSEVLSDKTKSVKLLALLCHEYFHLWNVKRIRPAELGPFNYNEENYTRMLWLAEGMTSYYDDLSAYRCGFHSRAEYLRTLTDEHLSRLLDVPGRNAMSIKDSSYLSWVKLYIPTADSANRFPSYYLKGGIIFLLLDLHIIAATDGARSLDDGMRALMDRYRAEPERGVTEEEFIAIVSGAVGVDIGGRLRGWLDSTDELPVEEVVGAAGLEWRRKSSSTESRFGDDLSFQQAGASRWSGLRLEETKAGLKVAAVLRDTPAEAAGIGADDEVIALNGMRVASMKQWEALLKGARAEDSVTITAAAEGRLYQTTLGFIPRESHELVEKAEPTELERRRLEKWLSR